MLNFIQETATSVIIVLICTVSSFDQNQFAFPSAVEADDESSSVHDGDWPQYDANPYRFPITIPIASGGDYWNSKGGFVIHDITGDGLMDYVLSFKEGRQNDESGNAYIGAYDHYGEDLWTKRIPDMRLNMKSEYKGLPGHYGPGFFIADINGDNRPELLHIDRANRLVIRDARSGEVEKKGNIPLPEGGGRWGGMVQVCNFRGEGMVDALLQAEYEEGDSRNAPDPHNPFHRVTAVKLDSYKDGEFEVLWHNTKYLGGRHYGARAMDIDGDGRDEVCGAVIVDENGKIDHDWRLPTDFNHYDSMKIRDARPELPGLEIFLLTEGGNQWVACVNQDRIVYRSSFENKEPQKGVVGEFDLSRPGLESWWANKDNNSDVTYRFPYVFDSQGELIKSYDFKSQYPQKGKERDWAPGGTTVIDWHGTSLKQAFMRGRFNHPSQSGVGNPVIFEPLEGKIIQWFDVAVRQCFPADVSGDYREEIVGIDPVAKEFVIWWNPDENPHTQERYWAQQWYRVAMQISDAYSVK